MTEEWRKIRGYPNYLASSYGRIHSLTSNCLMKTTPNSYGIHKVRLYNDLGFRDFYLHTIIVETFKRRLRDGDQVKHKNGDRNDHHVDNLYVVNVSKSDIPTYQAVSERGRPMFIVETGEIFSNARECAYAINGSYSAIYACLRGERGHHLGYTFQYL